MGGNRFTRVIVAGATALALVGVVACSSGSASAEKSSEKVDDSPAPATGDSPCRPDGDEKPSKALLRCGEHSVAFIETLYATGTGVVVEIDDEEYILTNLHVVDPFDSADVTVGGVSDLGRLAVVGADVAADIAILGPIEDADGLEPLPLGDPSVEKGDDVFLFGFPGSADVDEADLTITSGLVSRNRDSDGWDQTYIQSDAVIEDGQSGGPLFADTGDLIGISGLSYDEGFALALSIQDVETAVDRIIDGDGDDIIEVPQSADDEVGTATEPGATTGAAKFANDIETPTLFLPPSEEDRTWNLSVTGPEGRFIVGVQDPITGEPIAANAAGVALTNELIADASARSGMSAEALGATPPDVPAEVAARETSPGVFSIDVAAGDFAEVVLSLAPDAAPGALDWTSDQPLWMLTEELPVTTLQIGTPAEGIVGGYQLGVPFQVDLAAGQKVEFSASSPQGDVALVIAAPGHDLDSLDINLQVPDDALTFFDDSDEGLYGLDVLEKFTAAEAGTYQVWMQNYEISPLAYRVEVREPSTEKN
ncbi:hypothetical protein BH10ACT3_BH10ACT3_06900 [soil metagenome]